ncbi:MAG: hypothetical protein Q7J26_11115 [Brevundimonas sp.]|uniref:hypothetical protein n=1 Tax=Brevundimonas sp. TaxID=1871086 RepID=UPI0027205561|nr:hypothetical protein [Brevundimonas sp.]MDO9609065.1 hypothetical protein [Brevundimonas sp.]
MEIIAGPSAIRSRLNPLFMGGLVCVHTETAKQTGGVTARREVAGFTVSNFTIELI